jgi:signal transduction histidine kinase
MAKTLKWPTARDDAVCNIQRSPLRGPEGFQHMSRLASMKAKVVVFVFISTMALLALALNSLLTFNKVKVGGDAYNNVVASERLIADVLPPPAYIIEAYLTVQQLVNNTNPSLDPVLRDRLMKLEADYNERQTFYVDAVTGPELAKALKQDSQEPARRFFTMLHNDLLPALDAGDVNRARSVANNEMRDVYETHRAAIDRVVELASEDSDQAETSANNLVSSRSQLLIVTVIIAFLVTAGLGAAIAAAIIRPVRRVVHTATVTLPAMVDRIKETGDATFDANEFDVHSKDELGEATRAFNSVIQETVAMAKAQADLRRTSQENFVNLGRRSQNLLSRQIQLIETAEGGEDDPEVLDTLFKIDHLAARMRRNAESLLVLADRQGARKRRGPVAIDDVLRAATSEIEQYQRVQLAEGDAIELDGQYAAELVHLFAELLENATRFSSPDTEVTVSTAVTSEGCKIAIADQGIGLTGDDLDLANRRLGGKLELDGANYLGHFVVGRLASRLGASVHLEARPGSGGLTAVVFLPNELLTVSGTNDLLNRPARARKLVADRPTPVKETAVMPEQPSEPTADPSTPFPNDKTAEQPSEALVAVGVPAPTQADLGADANPNTPAASSSDQPRPAGTLTAESFGLRKRESGSSLAKTKRGGRRSTDSTASRNAETVRDRFSSFAAGRQQAQEITPDTDSAPDEESN